MGCGRCSLEGRSDLPHDGKKPDQAGDHLRSRVRVRGDPLQLQQKLPAATRFTGYEISPQAYDLCKERSNDRLTFCLQNYCEGTDNSCDLILLIDLIEHLEDYSGFLRNIRSKSRYKILHIPLEMFVLAVLHPQFLLGQRKKVGHLHYFSRDIALQVLREQGYEILDYQYTAGFSLPRNYGLKDKLLKIPRSLLYPLCPDLPCGFSGVILCSCW